ncbi:MAG: DNA polymerase IV [Burkholderiales bacterium]|nr:DNA polymerase IV [Bacteroidia bacterium]
MDLNNRKIIHIDMDAFFASVEQRDDPLLRGKPVAVGGSKDRGVVAAASYEARKYGVHSAMASKIAYQKCPELIFVNPDFDKYKKVSHQVMEIFHRFSNLVEPLSFDEAYLDVTQNKFNVLIATDLARQIKIQIKEETQLTASAGISYCKFLAKIASGYKKPDGLTVIKPENAQAFIDSLSIEDFYGIGKVTAAKMRALHIHKGLDLKQYGLAELIHLFGNKSGNYYYEIARGIDNRSVESHRIRKSIGAEETFDKDLTDREEIKKQLDVLTAEVIKRCLKNESIGKTITLKIKYNDFIVNTRSRTVDHFVSTFKELKEIVYALSEHPEEPVKPIRLLGITASNLNSDPETKTDKKIRLLQLKLELENR